jgi:hypothetical protein
MLYVVVIIGGFHAADRAAAKYGLRIYNTRPSPDGTAIVADVQASYDTLRKWQRANGIMQQPYPQGTLVTFKNAIEV